MKIEILNQAAGLERSLGIAEVARREAKLLVDKALANVEGENDQYAPLYEIGPTRAGALIVNVLCYAEQLEVFKLIKEFIDKKHECIVAQIEQL